MPQNSRRQVAIRPVQAGSDGLASYEALRQRARRRAHNKGLMLERLVKHALEVDGAKVERAPKVIIWRPEKPGQPAKPFSARQDFFRVWDLLYVARDGRRGFVQVTTLENVAHKRVKILHAGFPATPDDRILAQERGRVFRELVGPGFAMPGRTLTLPALPRRARSDAPHIVVSGA